ncbi:unnamed protein product [Agarophyton chilense]
MRGVRASRAGALCSFAAAPPSPHCTMSAPLYAVAPMMDVTDRHFRVLARLISRHATLYTEMVVDRTLIHNASLRRDTLRVPSCPAQRPLALQLGGSVPHELAAAAELAASFPYDELNLNCGCPSPKVASNGCFGAALMRVPHVVADACNAMRRVLPSHVAITVKCRLGVDELDSYEALRHFVTVVSERGGVSHFIIHARKAILGGLSPQQNRTVPPLNYHFVYQLIHHFPHLRFSINGGFHTVQHVKQQLQRGVYGVMVGRAVMNRPWHALCDVDHVVYKCTCATLQNQPPITRRIVIEQYVRYARAEMDCFGCTPRALMRPLLNLFHGESNGKRFRRAIDDGLKDRTLRFEHVVQRACAVLPPHVLDAVPPSLSSSTAFQTAPLSNF